MPELESQACLFEEDRPDYSNHAFVGANNWVLNAIRNLNPNDFVTGLQPQLVENQINRTEEFMRAASDMELSMVGGNLNVRIINQTGHKLPTGYPEGRRMWLNVRFFDADDTLIAESGEYDYAEALLDLEGTKVYEMKAGMSEEVAAATNLPAGESFHLALNNVRLFDNRIPPRGATVAELTSVGAESIPLIYADNQYWDDTRYIIPAETANVVATLYYQTSTREYMDFLRNTAKNTLGSTAHSLWVSQGKSAPEPMDVQGLELPTWRSGDINRDGCVDGVDLTILLGSWGACSCPADLNGDGLVDGLDLTIVLGNWGC